MLEEKFLIAENPPSMPGPGLVLCTELPFLIGKVIQFKTPEEVKEFTERRNNYIYAFCKGYRIAIQISKQLTKYVPKGETVNYLEITEAMADYWLNNKILKNESHHKRYKDEI